MPSKSQSRDPKQNKANITHFEKPKKKSPLFLIFTTAILVLLLVTFIIAPGIGTGSSDSRLIFGKYAGYVIDTVADNYFLRQVERINKYYTDNKVPVESVSTISQIWRSAFYETAYHYGVLYTAQKNGFSLSEKSINDAIIDSGYYNDSEGNFSKRKYDATSVAEKTRIREDVSESLLRTRFEEEYFLSERVSQNEINFVNSIANIERRYNYLYFNTDDYPVNEIEKYVMANSSQFRKIKLSRITIKSGIREAEDIRWKAVNGEEEFDVLARSFSQDAYKDTGGDMGWIFFYEMSSFLDDANVVEDIYSLKVNGISPVYETDYGWLLFRCDEETRGPDFTLEDDISSLRFYMNIYEKGTIEDYYIEKGNEIVRDAKSSSLKSVASIKNLPYGETDFFPSIFGEITLNTMYGQIPMFNAIKVKEGSDDIFSNASTDETFLTAIYTTTIGDFSEPLVLDPYIIIMQAAEQHDLGESPDKPDLTFFYKSLIQQYTEQDLRYKLLTSKSFVDNFDESFAKIYNVN